MISRVDFASTIAEMRGAGPHKCSCGVPLEFPGVCDPCGAIDDARTHNATLAKALSSIPKDFRPCRFGWSELPGRVKLSARAIAELRASAAPMVLLRGPGGAGKTTLACAMMREIIDAGRYGCEPTAYTIARGAMFVLAADLAVARTQHALGQGEAPLVSACIAASLLVLDNLGDAGDKSGTVSHVLTLRRAEGQRTIVTTYLDLKSTREKYDDGTARRLFSNSKVAFLGGES